MSYPYSTSAADGKSWTDWPREERRRELFYELRGEGPGPAFPMPTAPKEKETTDESVRLAEAR